MNSIKTDILKIETALQQKQDSLRREFNDLKKIMVPSANANDWETILLQIIQSKREMEEAVTRMCTEKEKVAMANACDTMVKRTSELLQHRVENKNVKSIIDIMQSLYVKIGVLYSEINLNSKARPKS